MPTFPIQEDVIGPWGYRRNLKPKGSPWPVPPPDPAPARRGGGLLSLLGGGGGGGGQGGQGGGGFFGSVDDDGGSFRDMLGGLGSVMMMLDPMSASAGSAMMQLQQANRERRRERGTKNDTMAWLQTQGVGPVEAKFLAGNPNALNSWYTSWKSGQTPDWQFHDIYDDKGQKQTVMVDMKTGRYQAIGGAAPPNLKTETIFKDGREQKVLMNEKGEIVTELGGTKSEMLTPEEVQQKIDIAKAGKTDITTQTVVKGEEQYAKDLGAYYAKRYAAIQDQANVSSDALGDLGLMRQALNDPSFDPGAGGDYLLLGKQWLQRMGYKVEGIDTAEQFNSLAKKAAKAGMGGTLGTGFSEGDRKFVEGMYPNITVSKGGNLALIAIQEKIHQRNLDIAEMASDYTATGAQLDAGFDRMVRQFAKANPLFTQQDMDSIRTLAKAANAPRVTTPPPASAPGEQEVPGFPGVTVVPRVEAPTVQPPAVETRPRLNTLGSGL